jgi:hypothetical protein
MPQKNSAGKARAQNILKARSKKSQNLNIGSHGTDQAASPPKPH